MLMFVLFYKTGTEKTLQNRFCIVESLETSRVYYIKTYQNVNIYFFEGQGKKIAMLILKSMFNIYFGSSGIGRKKLESNKIIVLHERPL